MLKIIPLSFAVFLIGQTTIAQNIISSELLNTYTQQELFTEFGLFAANGIELHKFLYFTPNAQGVPDTASGLVVLPVIEDSAPLVVYHHGTTSPRENVASREQFHLGELFYGSQGYIVSSADMLGMGDSDGFHPYLHAATQASASIDLLRAVQAFCEAMSIPMSEQLFVTGYSQGGHAAMATFKALETLHTDEFTVTAATPMSGPYDVTGTLQQLLFSGEEYFFSGYFAYIAKGYQEIYGDIYESLSEVFVSPYVEFIEQFDNQPDYDLSQLNNDLSNLLVENHGGAFPAFILQPDLVEAFRTNDQNNPVLRALADNNLFDWVPRAPTRLYYCEADDQVPFENATFTDSLMNANGATDVQSLSMGEDFDHNGCVLPAFLNGELFFRSFLMPTSTQTVTQEANLLLYPNPVAEELHWSLPEQTTPIKRVFLTDPLGRVIELDRQSPASIGHLAAGHYVLHLIFSEQHIAKSFVKME